jgi:ribosomal-protein-alanine N-acetyltransferase
VTLRPIRQTDRRAWHELRDANREWLAPWDATTPAGVLGDSPGSFFEYVQQLSRQARRGQTWPWVVLYQGRLVGQLTVAGISRAAVLSANIGYWVSRDVAGRGIAPTAVALAFDHATGPGGLHRLEVAIRPENERSLRVVAKLGFRDEGLRQRFLHVAGAWRDHRVFALTREEVPDGLLERWRAVSGHQIDPHRPL